MTLRKESGIIEKAIDRLSVDPSGKKGIGKKGIGGPGFRTKWLQMGICTGACTDIHRAPGMTSHVKALGGAKLLHSAQSRIILHCELTGEGLMRGGRGTEGRLWYLLALKDAWRPSS